MVHHRNPLFSLETGVTPQTVVALGWLHTLSLGVFQTFVTYCMHMLLAVGVWSTHETTGDAVR